MRGTLGDGKLAVEEVHRFANRPVALPGNAIAVDDSGRAEGVVTREVLDEALVLAAREASRVAGETRADDRTSEAAMEDRKREGYF